MTLMDVSMSWAARFYNQYHETGAMTINFNASFLSSGTGLLICNAKVIHKTLTLAFCESNIIDTNNNLIASSSATFKYAKKLN